MNKKRISKRFILVGCIFGMLALMIGCESKTDDTAAKKTETGSARGYGGDVRVSIDVVDHNITAITAEGPSETETIGGKAISDYNNELFASLIGQAINSVDADSLDTVSGATITSGAVKEALKEAIAKSK